MNIWRNSFRYEFLWDFIDMWDNKTPKRIEIEAYMVAGVAAGPSIFPESAIDDYDAALGESRVNSDLRLNYLLETSNFIAFPQDETVRVLVTSEDVIHS
ncbi:hypothetical protein [Arachidicoccus sp.]|uniref:hypothetical protein n=1 Tax=Arachidicoccus sp. TaxID=1872624 RepID=UPI003D1F3F4C